MPKVQQIAQSGHTDHELEKTDRNMPQLYVAGRFVPQI